MKKIRRMLCTVVVLASAVSICQAEDDLEAKLARLEAASKAQNSGQNSTDSAKSSQPTALEESNGKRKTLTKRIDELEAQQKGMQETNVRVDARITELERKLQALEIQSKPQQAKGALSSRITELEKKVQVLEEKKVHVLKEQSDGLPVEPPAIKMTKLGTTPPFKLPEDDITFEVTADYFGKYVWRGQNLSDDPVFQPGASLSMGGLTAGFWGNLETTNINNQNGEFTEFDWSLDYSGDVSFIDGVSYSIGVINYYLPSVDDTTEVYWGFGLDLPLSPSITIYHDVDDVKGTYGSFGLSHSIEKIAVIGPEVPVGMDISASLGWGSASYNKVYWDSTVDTDKLNDLSFSISFPFEVSGFTMAPSLNYVTLANGKARESDAYSSESDYFFAGIGVSKGF